MLSVYEWFFAGTISCSARTVPQTKHFWPAVSPVAVHVGSTAGIVIGLCPSSGTMVCCLITVPQIEHLLPSVKPVSVQLGSTAAMISIVCPLAGTISCFIIISPHTEHLCPSVKPVFVQVGATAGTVSGECAASSPYCALHTVHCALLMQVAKPPLCADSFILIPQPMHVCQ